MLIVNQNTVFSSYQYQNCISSRYNLFCHCMLLYFHVKIHTKTGLAVSNNILVNINVRPGLLEPRQDQTVETIIQDYFNKQFECTPIKCHDCPNLLPGTQSFAVINSPSYISFAIERYFKLFLIV